MLFGAIVVGTNSIHLIIVDCDSIYDTSRVVHKAREMVRLGSNDALERGRLSSKAMTRGVEAISRFVETARQRGAERIRAVATSAVREADNGVEFRARVEAQTGVLLEILAASEEARLIHLGVASGFSIDDRTACIIDIGGGSTEFIVADGDRPYLLDSVKLGSLRLYDAFLRDALFERLADLHGLAGADRDLLYAAALLHGVGRFIAESGCHKHSAYIIRASPFSHWRDDERGLIAQIARYYRKAMPKPAHPDFAALAPAEQERVEKLAALLRLADGLDSRHLGLVNDVTVRRESGQIVLLAQAETDISRERAAAMLKADLFERTFGVQIAIETQLAELRA